LYIYHQLQVSVSVSSSNLLQQGIDIDCFS
jgi:hypothetical protein